MEGTSQRLRKAKSLSLVFAGVFIGDCGLVHVSFYASEKWSEQGQGPGVRHKSLIP